MKKYLVLLLFLVTSAGFAQSVNDYQYVIVPSKFSFTKDENKFGLNQLTKAMLQKYGFIAYLDTDDMPDDVRDHNCSKLYADVIESNTITHTKLTIILKDCRNSILFTSAEGKSKEKEWKVSYNEALRNAGKSFDELGYKYNGTVTEIKKEIVKTTNDGTTVKTETIAVTPSPQVTIDATTLFAQPILNGYQLVDTTPKKVMAIYLTGAKDLYLAEKGDVKGVLRNNKGSWVFEYYANGVLKTESLNIKF